MTRKYSLFEVVSVNGKKKYIRVAGAGAYAKPQAIKVFQNRLLAYSFGTGPLVELRPVKD